ncbi:TonB-linked SusC/RagA family outer membrane protein [Flavobacterium sp. 90]|uniref:SusC/RagA family TonB-linked outer membrane protein n=1 Tax=unclassified Flavobacterium TaxID=196869 RepID=UPI000EB01DF1|nr:MULTISPECIES: TonB-dependent receptor [unclassified Flavobacterium]RKR11085.1 TonB-linked SusC/RagA family outer membrane protein [Flavobacterium sp. 81]TCK54868.1 TonB-linked SusC/RagA family outer membrane protein [Flavobacterium sp. 90]
MNFKDLFNKGANCCFVVVFLLCLLTSNRMSAQGVTVEGTVKDAAGLTLPGVNIIENGTKNSASTDLDGHYIIKITNPKAVLSFSSIGFKSKEIAVAGKTKLDVSLIEDSHALNEVVVVGYGTVKKSDLTGAVASISGNDLKKIPVSNVAEALTGRIAGVQVTSTEGSPDADIKIRVRGGGSLTQDASPLIIVDGFPVNSMSDIAASNIESMTVLKDASSTAIYGSRGANGVIIITTKTGKDGKMAVSFNMFYGMKTMAKDIDVLPVDDFVKWQYEYALLDQTDKTILSNPNSYTKYFGNWQDRDLYNGVKGTNWQKQIYGRRGEVNSRDLGIRGGNDKLSYNFNYAYYDEKAIMVGSDFKRNNLSLALKNKASEKVDLAFTVRYSDTEINGGGANEQNEVSSLDSRLRHSVGYSPVPMPGLTTDNDDQSVNSYLVNPFLAISDNERQQTKKNYNLLGSFGWKLIENLKFQSDLGLDNYNYSDYRFYGSSTYFSSTAKIGAGKPGMVMADRKDVRFRNANTLNYDFKNILGNNHHLTALLGEEMITTTSNVETTTMLNYPKFFDLDDAKKLTTQGTPFSVDNFYSPDDKLLSFFGRVNYDFKDRYLLTASFRADGSSRFLGDNRWGYFPAAAAAWKISEEDFLKNASWLSLLKLRLSYGEAGNNNIPVGQTVQSYMSNTNSFINGFDSYWSPSSVLANPNLKWETTVTQNLGLDFGFFRNRLNGTVDVYKNVTHDLLIEFPVGGTGYKTQYRNMGETQNTGFEATLNFIAIENKNYGLNFSVNVGINKNKINSLGVMDNFGVNTNWASTDIGNDYAVNAGSPMGLMYGYKSDGRYEVSDFNYVGGKYVLKAGIADATSVIGSAVQPGMMKLKNTDGSADNKVTASDQTIIGNANPKSTGGLVINANAYGFDLSAAFNWTIGNDIYNANKAEFSTANRNGQYKNLSSEMADGKRWTNLDPASGQLVTDPTALESLNANTTMWSPYMQKFMFTDWAVEDGSFFRLNTLTLGYTTPESFTSKLGVSKLRFYFTATNVFIITNYSGPDPEVSTKRKSPLTPGVDYSAYPRSRQLVFGLNLNF